LLKKILEDNHIKVSGSIEKSNKNQTQVPLFYTHYSHWNLSQVVQKMFKYSNNYIANQIFLTLGAEKYGSPATPAKSRRALREFLSHIGLKSIYSEEGSGLSRKNRISTEQMSKVLNYFKPYYSLLNNEKRVWYKTGTLNDVQSLAGYLQKSENELFSFVIILNGTNYTQQDREKILNIIEQNILD